MTAPVRNTANVINFCSILPTTKITDTFITLKDKAPSAGVIFGKVQVPCGGVSPWLSFVIVTLPFGSNELQTP